jgi:hypothetical protein
MEDVPTRRLFYNGCSTAKLDGTTFGVPRSANLAFSALRGYATEYIGNQRFGICSFVDFFRFIALSSLGYPPACAVEVMQRLRCRNLSYHDHSIVYIGDAANVAWPVGFALPFAEVTVGEDEVRVAWRDFESGILAARIPSGSWGELAIQDLLDIMTTGFNGGAAVAGDVVADPWSDATLILLRVQEAPAALSVSLRRRTGPLDRRVGALLQQALDEIDFLCRVGTFGELATEANTEFSNALISFRRIARQDEDLINVAARISWIENSEAQLVHLIDERLVAEACRRTSSRENWYWVDAYAECVSTAAIDVPPGECPLCAEPTFQYARIDLLRDTLRRVQTICAECGLIADLPLWDTDAHFVRGAAQWDGVTYQDQLLLRNRGGRARRYTAEITMDDYNVEEAGCPTLYIVDLAAGKEIVLDYSMRPGSPSAFQWIRAFLASEAAFGFVARPFIF